MVYNFFMTQNQNIISSRPFMWKTLSLFLILLYIETGTANLLEVMCFEWIFLSQQELVQSVTIPHSLGWPPLGLMAPVCKLACLGEDWRQVSVTMKQYKSTYYNVQLYWSSSKFSFSNSMSFDCPITIILYNFSCSQKIT